MNLNERLPSALKREVALLPSMPGSWLQPVHTETAKVEAPTLPTFISPSLSPLLTHRRERSGERHPVPPCWCSSWPGATSSALVEERKELLSPGSPGIWALPTRPLGAEATGAKSARSRFRPPPADTPADASRPRAGTSTASTPQRCVHAGHPAGAHETQYSAQEHSVGTPEG